MSTALLTPLMQETELILNPDGSVYHLKLRPEHLAETVIVTGDQGRVAAVSKYFDRVEFKVQNREFITHTGYSGKKRITVLSTGIGTDNIDIVMNELDALVNIDLNTRAVSAEKRSLDIIRIGTSGALQPDLLPDSFVVSAYGLGLDGLLNYYGETDRLYEKELSAAFMAHTSWDERLPYPYAVRGSDELAGRIGKGLASGITATAPGFYGPQGRALRLKPLMPGLNEALTSFRHEQLRITNFEMETSALYGLARLLGHRACTVCTIIANRVIKKYSPDHHPAIDRLIRLVLERLTSSC
ncbi:MAG: nucleoside phosphorylase [Bacteroidota bacterium]